MIQTDRVNLRTIDPKTSTSKRGSLPTQPINKRSSVTAELTARRKSLIDMAKEVVSPIFGVDPKPANELNKNSDPLQHPLIGYHHSENLSDLKKWRVEVLLASPGAFLDTLQQTETADPVEMVCQIDGAVIGVDSTIEVVINFPNKEKGKLTFKMNDDEWVQVDPDKTHPITFKSWVPETALSRIDTPNERFRYLGIAAKYTVSKKDFKSLKADTDLTSAVETDFDVWKGLDPKQKKDIIAANKKVLQETANFRRFTNRLTLILDEAANRRRLVQTYQSTAELAQAFNLARVFDNYRETNSSNERKRERLNPFEDNLKKVALRVLEEFSRHQHPSKEKIEEIVALSAMECRDVNIGVYNAMSRGLGALYKESLTLPDPHMVAGFSKMIRLLPPQFLDDYVDKVLNVIEVLTDYLSAYDPNLNRHGRSPELLDVFRILKDLLDGLVDNRQLQIMDHQNRYFTSLIPTLTSRNRNSEAKNTDQSDPTKSEELSEISHPINPGLSSNTKLSSVNEFIVESSKNIMNPIVESFGLFTDPSQSDGLNGGATDSIRQNEESSPADDAKQTVKSMHENGLPITELVSQLRQKLEKSDISNIKEKKEVGNDDASTGSIPTSRDEIMTQFKETLFEPFATICQQSSVFDTAELLLSSFDSMLLGATVGNKASLLEGCTHFLNDKINGDGIDKDRRQNFIDALKKFENHPDLDVRYLAAYCNQALARIPAKGDGDIANFGKRGLHLILGAKSLALIIASQGTSLGEYQVLAGHLKQALQDSRPERNDWYEMARRLDSLMKEASEDPKKHQTILDILEVEVVNRDQPVGWQLVKMCLDATHEPIIKSGNKHNQMMYTRMLAQLFMNPVYVKERDTRNLALTFLKKCATDPDDRTRAMAKEHLMALFNRYSKKRSWGAYTWGANLVRDLPNLQTLAVRDFEVIEPDRQDHALLKQAKETAFPIEDKLGKLRQSVEQFRMNTTLQEELASYVPLKGSSSKDETNSSSLFRVMDRVNTFVNSASNGVDVMLIHGQAGSGKSLFARYVERSFWNRYRSGGVIPLFISLPTLQDPFHHGIEQMLITHGFTPDEIQQLKVESNSQAAFDQKLKESANSNKAPKKDENVKKENDKKKDSGQDIVFFKRVNGTVDQKIGIDANVHPPRLLVILDGYDELKNQVNLYHGYGFGNWKSLKVIVTARTEYLEQLGDFTRNFTPEKGRFSEVFIRPFDQIQQETYVRQLLAKSEASIKGKSILYESKELLKFIKAANMSSFIEHPFMLKIIVEIQPELKAKQENQSTIGLGRNQITRYDVYELFLERWFERHARQILTRTDIPEGFLAEYSFWEYSKAVASFMYTQQRQTIQGNLPSYSTYKATESEGAHFLTDELKVRLAMIGAPIKRVGPSTYIFIHKSIQEFLVARQIVDEIKLALEESSPLDPSAVINQRYLYHNPSVTRFVMDQMTEELFPALEKIILDSRPNPLLENQAHTKSPVAIAAANAMSLAVSRSDLKLFVNTDFSHIQIPGARLDGGYFEGVKFMGADLSDVSARGTVLRNCDCSNANLTGFQFGELPKIGIGAKNGVTFSKDGNNVASISDCVIRLWKLDTGESIDIGEPPDEAKAKVLAFSPDQKILAVLRADNKVQLYNTYDPTHVQTLAQVPGSIFTLAFSPCGKTLALSTATGVRLWHFEGKMYEQLTSDKSSVMTDSQHLLVFDAKGKTLAFVSQGTIELWDLEKKALMRVPQINLPSLCALTFSPDGKTLAIGYEKTIQMWNLGTTVTCGPQFIGESNIRSLAFNPDGKTLASGSEDKKIRVWSVESGVVVDHPLMGHASGVANLVYREDGKILVSCDEDTIRFWDIESGNHLKNEADGSILKYSLDRQTLAFGSSDGSIHLVSAKNGPSKWNYSLSGTHKGRVSALAFCPDGKMLASGGEDSTIRLWDVETGDVKGEPLEGHKEPITELCFSRNGMYLASGGQDNIIRMWNLETEEHKVHLLEGHTSPITSICFNPDGKEMASVSHNEIRVWKLASVNTINSAVSSLPPNSRWHKVKKDLPKKINPDLSVKNVEKDRWDKLFKSLNEWKRAAHLSGTSDDTVATIAYSSDGSILAKGSGRTIWLESTGESTGESSKQKIDTTHDGNICALAFSPNGKILASAGNDKTIRFWDKETGKSLCDPVNVLGDIVASLIYSPDGDRLVSCGSECIQFWDLKDSGVPTLQKIIGKWPRVLDLSGMFVSNARGLSDVNRRLIEQHNNIPITIQKAVQKYSSMVGFAIASVGTVPTSGLVVTPKTEFVDDDDPSYSSSDYSDDGSVLSNEPHYGRDSLSFSIGASGQDFLSMQGVESVVEFPTKGIVISDKVLNDCISRRLWIKTPNSNVVTVTVEKDRILIGNNVVSDQAVINVTYRLPAASVARRSNPELAVSGPVDITMKTIVDRLRGVESHLENWSARDRQFRIQNHSTTAVSKKMTTIIQQMDEIKTLITTLSRSAP